MNDDLEYDDELALEKYSSQIKNFVFCQQILNVLSIWLFLVYERHENVEDFAGALGVALQSVAQLLGVCFAIIAILLSAIAFNIFNKYRKTALFLILLSIVINYPSLMLFLDIIITACSDGAGYCANWGLNLG